MSDTEEPRIEIIPVSPGAECLEGEEIGELDSEGGDYLGIGDPESEGDDYLDASAITPQSMMAASLEPEELTPLKVKHPVGHKTTRRKASYFGGSLGQYHKLQCQTAADLESMKKAAQAAQAAADSADLVHRELRPHNEYLESRMRQQANLIEEQRQLMGKLYDEVTSLKKELKNPVPLEPSKKTYRRKEPNPTPPSYDGTGDLNEFLDQIDTIAEVQEWSDSETAMMVKTYCSGQALSAITGLRPDYEAVKRALRAEVLEKVETYSSQLKQRRQKKGESLTDLALDIKRLAKLIYGNNPAASVETTVRDSFI